MRGFEPEFAIHLVNESQTANRDRFRPAIIPLRYLAAERLLEPWAMCLLKIRCL
jgi:hypothetical protein